MSTTDHCMDEFTWKCTGQQERYHHLYIVQYAFASPFSCKLGKVFNLKVYSTRKNAHSEVRDVCYEVFRQIWSSGRQFKVYQVNYVKDLNVQTERLKEAIKRSPY